ncbi:MAG: hypothetical protein SFT93_05290 [Rickettsiaceae bacterium]|nr:hypothetical protein [Rickettsiaceae bacterium]
MLRCHPRENGDPGHIILLDSRLRGNDKKGDGNDKKGDGNDKIGCGNDKIGCGNDKIGCGNDSYGVIPVKTTITNTMSSPRRRGSRKHVIPSKEGIQGILSF